MNDRLEELRKLHEHHASQSGVGPSQIGLSLNQSRRGKDIEEGADPERAKQPEFMRTFFEQVDSIKNQFNDIHNNNDQILSLNNSAVQATAPEEEKELSHALEGVVRQTKGLFLRIKAQLEEMAMETTAIAEDQPKSHASQIRIRRNLHAALAKKFKDLIAEFQQHQEHFKDAMTEKGKRQVKIICPELSEDQAEEMAANGIHTAVQVQMLGGHQHLRSALADLQDKFRDIRLLEESVVELEKMWQDLAVLVHAQGELVDNILCSVQAAEHHIEGAEKALVETRKLQERRRKNMCWAMVCLLILAIIILSGVLLGS
eukprot:GDKH01016544.1.p1 GENE.GDKH01016544.1~~GDKH01016544.1.p1  ORF type:complete len:316 (-),score=39.50 GDKH01016544.1:65-1012(-)